MNAPETPTPHLSPESPVVEHDTAIAVESRRDAIATVTCTALLMLAVVMIARGSHDVPSSAPVTETEARATTADVDPTATAAGPAGDDTLADSAGVEVAALEVGQALRDTVVERVATELMRCESSNLELARDHVLGERYDQAERLLETELGCAPSDARAARVHFLRANIASHRGDGEAVLAHLDALDALADPGAVPRDYVEALRGETLLGLERYDEALAAWDAAASADRQSPIRHEAVVARALILFQAGRMEQAEAALDDAVQTYPEHPNLEQLVLMRGQARQALGRLDAAAADYDKIVWEWPWKESAAAAQAGLVELGAQGVALPTHGWDERLDRARFLRKFRHWDLAEAELRTMLSEKATADGHSFEENRLQFQIALNYYDASRYDEALPVLNDLVEAHARNDGDGTTLNTVYRYIVRCHAYSGRFDEAESVLKKQIAGYSSRSQKEVLAGFYEENGRFDKALRYRDQVISDSKKRTWDYALLLFNAGKYDKAADTLEYLRGRASGTTKLRYEYFLARSWQEGGRVEDASALFRRLAADDGDDYYGIQSANRLIEIEHHANRAPLLAAAGSAQGGTDSGSQVGLPTAAAPLAAGQGAVFSSDGETVAAGSETDGAVGADATAIAHAVAPGLTGFATDSAPDAARNQGAREVAATAPASAGFALTDVPVDRIRERMATGEARVHWGTPKLLASGGLQFVNHAESTDSGVEGASGGIKPAYAAGKPVDGALARAAEELGELFPRLRRASFLYDVGMTTEARWEARDVAIEYRLLASRSRGPSGDSPIALRYDLGKPYIDNRRSDRNGYWGMKLGESRYPVPSDGEARAAMAERQRGVISQRREIKEPLIQAFKEVGDYHIVRRFAQDTTYRRTDPMTGDKRDVWMEVHPRAFPRLVQTNAREQGLNPYLMWALMTVESTYNPDSISYADARGLLQVIPKTGIKCATTLEVDDYGPHDLLDERISIKFGTWYFSELVKKFHGQEPFAIAGYNGGPHNVARWVAQRGHSMDMDAFVETIPFDQARGYVKKVLRYAALYQRLYEDNPTLYVGNAINATFKAQPNY